MNKQTFEFYKKLKTFHNLCARSDDRQKMPSFRWLIKNYIDLTNSILDEIKAKKHTISVEILYEISELLLKIRIYMEQKYDSIFENIQLEPSQKKMIDSWTEHVYQTHEKLNQILSEKTEIPITSNLNVGPTYTEGNLIKTSGLLSLSDGLLEKKIEYIIKQTFRNAEILEIDPVYKACYVKSQIELYGSRNEKKIESLSSWKFLAVHDETPRTLEIEIQNLAKQYAKSILQLKTKSQTFYNSNAWMGIFFFELEARDPSISPGMIIDESNVSHYMTYNFILEYDQKKCERFFKKTNHARTEIMIRKKDVGPFLKGISNAAEQKLVRVCHVGEYNNWLLGDKKKIMFLTEDFLHFRDYKWLDKSKPYDARKKAPIRLDGEPCKSIVWRPLLISRSLPEKVKR